MFQIVPDKMQMLIFGVPSADMVSIISLLVVIITITISIRALAETARSNALASLPILMMRLEESGRDSSKIFIINEGNGVALNIRLENFDNAVLNDRPASDLSIPHKVLYSKLIFKTIDRLFPNKDIELDTSGSKINQHLDESSVIWQIFHYPRGNKRLRFHVRYSDASGAEYISKIDIYTDKIAVAGAPKRYDLIQKVIRLIVRLGQHIINVIVCAKLEVEQRLFNLKNGIR